MKPYTRANSAAGFSMVELMVALTLSTLLLGGVMTVIFTSRNTYDENSRMARLQEYARSGLILMLRDIRGAGYMGCSRALNAADVNQTFAAGTGANALRYDFSGPLVGFEGTAGPMLIPLGVGFAPALSTNNDAIIIRTLNDSLPVMTTAANMASAAATIAVNKPAGVAVPANQVMVVSDCEQASYFTNTATTGAGTAVNLTHVGGAGTPVNITAAVIKPFAAGSVVAAVNSVGYYVGLATSGRGNSLYRVVGNGVAQELIEGVERLEIQYGWDPDGDLLVDDYRDASATPGFLAVRAVAIALLLRSPEDEGIDAAGGTRTYNMLGNIVGPFADRRPRMLVTTTVNLRNRNL